MRRFPTFPKHCNPFSSQRVFAGGTFIHEFRSSTFTEEIAMQNVITIGREHIPVEQIAYIEPFEPPPMGSSGPTDPIKAASCFSIARPC